MPQLASLLYHNNPEICKLAAGAITETAGLVPKPSADSNSERALVMVRQWWEGIGIKKDWSKD